MHRVGETHTWSPFPPQTHVGDRRDRRDAYRALLLSAIGLSVTGAIELGIALLAHSAGLLGDALHNLSDVSTSLAVFVGLRLSRRKATESHPYGYNRAEDLAGLAVAVVIWTSAAFSAYISVHKLLTHGTTSHLALGMVAAAVGIAGNQLVARYKLVVGRRIQSATLLADARHSWLDAIASGGALLGLIGVAAGLPWADAVAGLVVTGFIAHVGWEVTSELINHLMDGVDPEILSRAESAALTVEDVDHVHVRARWSGRSLVVEVEGYLSPGTSIEEADRQGEEVQAAIAVALPESRAVLWSPHAMTPAALRDGERAPS